MDTVVVEKEVEGLEEAYERDAQAYNVQNEPKADFLLQRNQCKRLFNHLYQYVECLSMVPFIRLRPEIIQGAIVQRASASIDRLHQRTPPDQYGSLRKFLRYIDSWIICIQDVAEDVQQEWAPLQGKLQDIERLLNLGE